MNLEDNSLDDSHTETNIDDEASNVNKNKDTASIGAPDVQVRGDFVGGNKIVHGDEIHGDKIVAEQVIIQRLDQSDARNLRNHAALRNMVRSFWVDGVLKSSLYNEVLIRLNMEARPDAVDNQPWDLILPQPGNMSQMLLHNTSIMDVFDEMNHLLLILGEPGSGKTTMLLELAEALLKRAELEPLHPTPVVFNLSSWTERRQPLEKWLINEFKTRYNVPNKISKKWFEDGELILLLDGLDEGQEEYQNNCVDAINRFRQKYWVPMAVCSRDVEYEHLSVQLRLQGAVLLRPLTSEQIDEYLNHSSEDFSVIYTTIQQHPKFYELAKSPFMLGIISFTYFNSDASELFAAAMKLQEPYRNLFDAYIKHALTHRDIPDLYSDKNLSEWLRWLAKQLLKRNQSVFHIEQIQPTWLQFGSQRQLYYWVSNSVIGFVIYLAVGVIVGTSIDLFTGLIFGLIVSMIVMLIIGINSRNIQSIDSLRWSFGTIRKGIIQSIFSDLDFRIYKRLISKLGKINEDVSSDTIAKSQSKLKISETILLVVGSLSIGYFTYILIYELPKRVDQLPLLSIGVFEENIKVIALFGGLISALTFFATTLIFTGLTSSELESTQVPNQGIRRSVKNFTVMFILGGLFAGIGISINTGLVLYLNTGTTISFMVGLLGWPLGSLLVGLSLGGAASIQHVTLRLICYRNSYIPWNYARFLNYCHNRLVLRKVGGGYIFIHRMLMEHFANMTDGDIERIVADIENQ